MYGNDPDTPQGGLLFFPAPPPAEYLEGLNIRYLITTRELNEPFRLAWREETSPVKIYEFPSARPRIFLENPSAGGTARIVESNPKNHLRGGPPPPAGSSCRNWYPGWQINGAPGPRLWKPIGIRFPPFPPARETYPYTDLQHLFPGGPRPPRWGMTTLLTWLAGLGGIWFEKNKK